MDTIQRSLPLTLTSELARRVALLLALMAFPFGSALAQAPGSDSAAGSAADATAATEAVADAAPERADLAVREWVAAAPRSVLPDRNLSAVEICRQLPILFGSGAAPAGTEVRIEDRVERPSDEEGVRLFTYAAVRAGDRLDVVEVRLRRATEAPPEELDGWSVERVGFVSDLQLPAGRAWLQTPLAWWLFSAFSLLILVQLLVRGSQLRRWLGAGWDAIKQHRRLVIVTLAVLYAGFGLGALSGSALPEECEVAILEVVTTAVTSLGATDAYGSGNVARAAVTTFYQNFVVVTASVIFSLAALLGVPAYIFAGLSFFVQGIPFGLFGGAPFLDMVLILVLIALELTAYFLVVAGGGMLLVTLVSPGERRAFNGYRKLLLMVPIAMVLLLVGAWYEPLILLLGR